MNAQSDDRVNYGCIPLNIDGKQLPGSHCDLSAFNGKASLTAWGFPANSPVVIKVFTTVTRNGETVPSSIITWLTAKKPSIPA